MKTRIKVVIKGDDSKVFYPQYKTFLFWHNFTSLGEVVTHNSLRSSESFISTKMSQRNSEIQRKKIQSVKYIQYP